MSYPILLLGPSCVGKTTVVKEMQKKVKGIDFAVLDNIVHKSGCEDGLIKKGENLNALIKSFDRDWDRFLSYGIDVLNKYMGDKTLSPIIIDVGSGFLDSKNSIEWLKKNRSITILSNPKILHKRIVETRGLDISLEQYMATQFSRKRQEIYSCSEVVLNYEESVGVDVLTQRFLFSLLSVCEKNDVDRLYKEYMGSD